MASTFPTTLDAFTNPTATDATNKTGVEHATQHSDLNDAIEALEAKLGINSSAVATSIDYLVKKFESEGINTTEDLLGQIKNKGRAIIKAGYDYDVVNGTIIKPSLYYIISSLEEEGYRIVKVQDVFTQPLIV